MKKRVFPGQAPAPRMVDLTEPDGTTLQATYFGRWASLVRKCSCFTSATRDRKIWEEVAPRDRMF
jgi:hypothetical protein